MITPAISVLSAVEGIRIITPLFKPYVIPVTTIILSGLFLIQRRGTASVGRLFGPVILVWFIVLAALGSIQVVHTPQVLAAILPWYGVNFFLINKFHGFIVLGAVFLVATPDWWGRLPLFLLLGAITGVIFVAFSVLVGSLAFWVGNADNSPMQGVSGVRGAGPIWHNVMERALAGQPASQFARPEGIEEFQISAGETTPDGLFSLTTARCLGRC